MLVIQTCRRKTRGALTGSSTLKGSLMSELRAILAGQETAEVPQRQQLDRVVDAAVPIQPMYSKRSLSVKLGGARTERFFRHHEARDHGDG